MYNKVPHRLKTLFETILQDQTLITWALYCLSPKDKVYKFLGLIVYHPLILIKSKWYRFFGKNAISDSRMDLEVYVLGELLKVLQTILHARTNAHNLCFLGLSPRGISLSPQIIESLKNSPVIWKKCHL